MVLESPYLYHGVWVDGGCMDERCLSVQLPLYNITAECIS